MTLDDLRPNVQRGIALLSLRRPAWRDQIDWWRLNLNNEYDCVLGQLFGEWFRGLEALVRMGWLEPPMEPLHGDCYDRWLFLQGADFGFNTRGGGGLHGTLERHMSALWRELAYTEPEYVI